MGVAGFLPSFVVVAVETHQISVARQIGFASGLGIIADPFSDFAHAFVNASGEREIAPGESSAIHNQMKIDFEIGAVETAFCRDLADFSSFLHLQFDRPGFRIQFGKTDNGFGIPLSESAPAGDDGSGGIAENESFIRIVAADGSEAVFQFAGEAAPEQSCGKQPYNLFFHSCTSLFLSNYHV